MHPQPAIANIDARIQHAVDELRELIKSHYPTAAFEVAEGDDPVGTYLTAIVDLDDPDDVMDPIVERLLEIEIDERLPVYVVAVRTPERVTRLMQQQSTLQFGPRVEDLLGA